MKGREAELSRQVASEPSLDWREQAMKILGEERSRRGSSEDKGSEAGVCLRGQGSKEAQVAEWRGRKTGGEGMRRGEGLGQFCQALSAAMCWFYVSLISMTLTPLRGGV